MPLYLVQHGKAFSKDEDPERKLTEPGRLEVQAMAQVAKGYGVAVGKIFHSGKTRAQQTAEIMAEHLEPQGGLEQAEGLHPTDDVGPWEKRVEPDQNAMLVGHLPFLERLASQLVMGAQDHPVFKLQNGGILCLDREAKGQPWFVRWALMPHIGAV